MAGYSILIYRVSREDLQKAFEPISIEDEN